jgi:hypothetical protein
VADVADHRIDTDAVPVGKAQKPRFAVEELQVVELPKRSLADEARCNASPFLTVAGRPGPLAIFQRRKSMARSSFRTALTLAALCWLAAPLLADDREKSSGDLGKPSSGATAEQAARDTLARVARGDPGWKVRMEALLRLVKAGPAVVPVLEEALKKESPAARALAAQALLVLRGPAAIRKAATDFDLATLASARLGQAAPDFSLGDLSGKACRLSKFRGKKAVVLTFLMDDG